MGPSLAGHHGALADPNWPRPSVSIACAMAEAADGDEHLALTIQLSLDHAQPQGTAPAFGDGLAPRAAGEDSPHHAPAAELPEPAPAAEPPALSVKKKTETDSSTGVYKVNRQDKTRLR